MAEDSRITCLINKAGISGGGDIATIDPNFLEAMVQLNVVAPSRLIRAILPRFITMGGGTIINIGSVLSLAPELFEGAYSAGKAYLLNFSLALHKQVGDSGIRVQVVLPGVTRTPMFERSGGDNGGIPANIVMDVDDLVDAALAGLDMGEVVTIPSLPDEADWTRYTEARMRLIPNLSHQVPASRYGLVRA